MKSTPRVAAVILLVLMIGATGPVSHARTGSPGAAEIIEIPVSFEVVNKNDSEFPCISDGGSYVVHGHLTGPRRDLLGEPPDGRVVTILLYGYDGGEWNWRFQDIPEYDYPYEMAKLGHVSLSIDMLGYDSSGHPPGHLVCWGSQADINHQIVQLLRDGTYEAGASYEPVEFETVLVSAHDVGPFAALVESYTWDDIDGISIQVLAHQGFEPYIISIFGENIAECALGGEGAEDPKDEPTRGGGYVFFGPPDDQFRNDLFLEDENATGPGGTDPSVIEAFLAVRNRNPCGHVTSNASVIRNDLNNLQDVEVPILLVYPGPDDPVISRSGEEAEAANYGSTDVTTAWLDSGHFMMLERCAPAFRLLTAHWIHERWGSGHPVSAPAVGSDECVTEVRVKET